MADEGTDIATVEELSLFIVGCEMDQLLNILWEVSLCRKAMLNLPVLHSLTGSRRRMYNVAS